jgi:hypothetical protein
MLHFFGLLTTSCCWPHYAQELKHVMNEHEEQVRYSEIFKQPSE